MMNIKRYAKFWPRASRCWPLTAHLPISDYTMGSNPQGFFNQVEQRWSIRRELQEAEELQIGSVDCVVILICAASSSVVSALQPSVGLLCLCIFSVHFFNSNISKVTFLDIFFFIESYFVEFVDRVEMYLSAGQLCKIRQFQATIEWRRIMIVAMLFKSKFLLSWGNRSGPIRPLHNVRSVFRALWPFRPSSAQCRSCVTGCTFYLWCRACWD